MREHSHYEWIIVVVLALFFLLRWLNISPYFKYVGAALVTYMLPDLLEPAKDYTHRRFFHSKCLLKILLAALLPVILLGLVWSAWLWLAGAMLGYIVHLLVDSVTKMGLVRWFVSGVVPLAAALITHEVLLLGKPV